jgi:hypothetical protein
MKSLLLLGVLLLTADLALAANAYVRTDGGENVVEKNDVTVSSTAVLIAASNANRATLNCTTTAAVRWGGSGVTAAKGQAIPANVSIGIQNTAAIYMIAESVDATVSCTEETWNASSSSSPIFSP